MQARAQTPHLDPILRFWWYLVRAALNLHIAAEVPCPKLLKCPGVAVLPCPKFLGPSLNFHLAAEVTLSEPCPSPIEIQITAEVPCPNLVRDFLDRFLFT